VCKALTKLKNFSNAGFLSEESIVDDGAVETPTLFILDEGIQVIPK
jgi:hypothetical protein